MSNQRSSSRLAKVKDFKDLGLLNSRSLKNVLGRGERNDLYRFTLGARSSFAAQLNRLKANANLELLNSNRSLISASRKPGKQAEAVTSVLEAGVYYIRVARRGKDTAYRLSLSASAAPLPPVTQPPVTQPASFGLLSTASSQLGRLDRATGTFSLLSSSIPNLTDIARFGNDVYGVNFNSLYKINPDTGAATLVGSLGFSNANALGFSASGVLYAAGGSSFYSVNPQTGAATLVASIPGFSSSGDLVFDASSNRFLATSGGPTSTSDTLYSIDLSGAATPIGNIGFSNVFGLAQDGNIFYGYTTNRLQIRINPLTGAGTFDRTLSGTSSVIYGAT